MISIQIFLRLELALKHHTTLSAPGPEWKKNKEEGHVLTKSEELPGGPLSPRAPSSYPTAMRGLWQVLPYMVLSTGSVAGSDLTLISAVAGSSRSHTDRARDRDHHSQPWNVIWEAVDGHPPGHQSAWQVGGVRTHRAPGTRQLSFSTSPNRTA